MTQGEPDSSDRGVIEPRGLALAAGRLFIACRRTGPSTGNSEGQVQIFNSIPSSSYAQASALVGNSPYEDCSPYYLGSQAQSVATDGTRLFVTGSSGRVMIYNSFPA